MDAVVTKWCWRCKEQRQLSDFTPGQRQRPYSHCQECAIAYRREYKEYNIARILFGNAKCRAKKAGIEFTITLADLPRYIPDACPWLGIPLRLTHDSKRDNSPSLDRINNQLGYVPGNVIIISWRANRLKSDATADELMKVARAMKKAK